jgi:succinate dehydrogenase / fumarate reductase cytochrome b subunit
VKAKLGRPGNALIYLLAALALGVHLSHGFRSAFQSIGINHPRWNPLLVWLGRVIAFAFAIGFASFPIYFLITGEGSGS